MQQHDIVKLVDLIENLIDQKLTEHDANEHVDSEFLSSYDKVFRKQKVDIANHICYMLDIDPVE